MTNTPEQRLMLVHAHPDDESIGQGATMAKYVAEGRGVTLVTCTAGELGEILVPELEHLAADRDDGLGEHRQGELDAAMAALGVTDYRYLGGFGTYRDSGMKWHDDGYAIPADDVHDNAFWNADLTEAADHSSTVIREVRPQVLVTYDQFGGYGHPDHIQAHRVATYATTLAAVPSYEGPRRAVGRRQGLLVGDVREPDPREPAAGCARPVTPRPSTAWSPTATAGRSSPPTSHQHPHRRAPSTSTRRWPRWRAHRSQVEMDGPFFRCSENGQSMWGEEFYRIAKGTPGRLGRGRLGAGPLLRTVTSAAGEPVGSVTTAFLR